MSTDAPALRTAPYVPLTFTVYGVPIPKGSAKGFVIRPKGGGPPRAVVTHDNPKTKPWQEAIVSAAVEALAGREEMLGPVALVVCFYLPRPKSAPRRVVKHLTRPDLDKLLRCVKDGLTRAGAYRDDSQVVYCITMKDFAGGVADPLGLRGIPRATVSVEARA